MNFLARKNVDTILVGKPMDFSIETSINFEKTIKSRYFNKLKILFYRIKNLFIHNYRDNGLLIYDKNITKNLEKLYIRGSRYDDFIKLDGGNLNNLIHLELNGFYKVILDEIPKLKKLILCNIDHYFLITNMNNLTHLHIKNSSTSCEMPNFCAPNLEYLELTNCGYINIHLNNISHLSVIKTDITLCTYLPNLKYIHMNYASSICNHVFPIFSSVKSIVAKYKYEVIYQNYWNRSSLLVLIDYLPREILLIAYKFIDIPVDKRVKIY